MHRVVHLFRWVPWGLSDALIPFLVFSRLLQHPLVGKNAKGFTPNSMGGMGVIWRPDSDFGIFEIVGAPPGGQIILVVYANFDGCHGGYLSC